MRRAAIAQRVGREYDDATVTRILEGLGGDVQYSDGVWTVVPPSWRFDLAIPADLIEEIARIDGYAHVPDRLPAVEYQHGAGEKRALALVGIGYPGGQLLDHNARSRDYTPPLTEGGANSGEAEAFARFLDEELPPLLASRQPIDRRQQSLYGHSYGGLFALYHLYTRASMQRYYLASPSLWWENRRIDDFADRLTAPRDSLAVRISVGSLEQAAAGDAKRRSRAMVENARALAGQLQQNQRDTTFTLLDGDNHGSAAFSALTRLLQDLRDTAPAK